MVNWSCEFTVNELVRTLHEHAKGSRFTIAEIVDLGVQVSTALATASNASAVHGGIRPEAILIRREPAIALVDVGPARSDNTELEPSGFMSPEQARGLPVDARTDVFSLGAVLYALAADRAPFEGATSKDLAASIIATDPGALTRYAPDVPAEFERIVTKALRKDPEQRYQTIKGLEVDLKALKRRLEQDGSDVRSTDSRAVQLAVDSGSVASVAQAGRLAARRNRVAIAMLAVALAATIASIYFLKTRFAAADQGGITSLAVLPFQNVNHDPGTEYLSEGITESLINQLSQLPGLKVIAHSSSSRYKGKSASPQEVARALETTGIIAGRISQRGDDLSVSVELIDGRDSTQVWGEQYVRKAGDVVRVQAEISRQIADKLRLHLTTSHEQQLARVETVNPAAFELLLKGRFYRAKGGTEDRKRATEYFTQAIAVDPAYAAAYAELSDHYRGLVNSSILDPSEYLPKAEQAALRALEIDEGLAEAHYALANLETQAWQWAEADRGYRRAIELNPNLALAHRWYASYLRLMGRHAEAIAEIERARALDPLSPVVNATVGYILYNARQYDRAIATLQKVLELDRNYSYPYVLLGYTYAAQGRYADAIAAYQEAIKRGRTTPSTEIFLGTAYARAGERAPRPEDPRSVGGEPGVCLAR